MRSRLAIAFLIVFGSCLAFAASASACQIANLVLSPKTVGPGDTVYYSISGIAPTATYSFTIAGIEVSGTNDSSVGVDGSFTMPDLGSKGQTATANGTCSCPEDLNTQGLHDWLTYAPPPPAAPPASPATTDAPAVSPAPVVGDSSPRSHHRRHPSSPVAVAKHSAKQQRHDSPASNPVVGSARSDSVGDVSGPRDPSSGSGEAKQAGEEPSTVPDHVLHALGSTASVGPAKVPTIGLIAIGLLLIAGLGMAGLAIYIFRNGPDPDAAVKAPAPPGPDPVEEELQQVIADEMARQLLRSLDLAEPTPGQPDAEPALSSQHRT